MCNFRFSINEKTFILKRHDNNIENPWVLTDEKNLVFCVFLEGCCIKEKTDNKTAVEKAKKIINLLQITRDEYYNED